MGRPGPRLSSRFSYNHPFPVSRQSSFAAYRQLIEDIAYTVNRNQYDRLPDLLQQLGPDGNQHTIAARLTTPPIVIKQLRDADLEIRFDDLYHLDEWEWNDLISIAANSPRPIPIQWNLRIGQSLFNYCQLAKIPFIIIDGYQHSNNKESLLSQLDINDIESLDEDNRRAIHSLSITHDYPCCLRLLRATGMTEIPGTAISDMMDRLSMYNPWANRDQLFDDLRDNVDNEHMYTSPRFDDHWKRLTPEVIISRQFNPQHLLRIGMEIPDINLIMTIRTDVITTMKKLLPYSNLSRENIETILRSVDRGACNRSNNNVSRSIDMIIVLVRYKRQLMIEYIDHPFIEHLIWISEKSRMKNSRTNTANC